MTQTLTIARRELSSLFFSPIAYIVLIVFAIGTTLIFSLGFWPTGEATLRGTFEGVVWLMILLIPAISMRLFAEEFRSGTIETLLTSPITDTQTVVGKWLGAVGFLAALLLPMVVLVFVLAATSRPDFGPILTGLLGVILVGGLYLAIGVFASAITQNQIIAFIVTVFIICLLSIAMLFLFRSSYLPSWAREVVAYLWINNQVEDFNKGIIDSSKLVYFITGIGFFLFLSVKALESRRWR